MGKENIVILEDEKDFFVEGMMCAKISLKHIQDKEIKEICENALDTVEKHIDDNS